MKRIFVYITILFAATMLIFVKCGKNDEGTVYTYYFSNTYVDTEDSIKVEKYLKPKNIAKITTFNGALENTDQQAVQLFNEMVSKISVTELDALQLKPTTTLTYAVSRWKQPSNPYSGTVIIKSFTYP